MRWMSTQGVKKRLKSSFRWLQCRVRNLVWVYKMAWQKSSRGEPSCFGGEATLLRVDSGDQLVDQFASPRDSRGEVASKALLAVESKEHHEKRCSQARRQRRTWHSRRRSRRCRSLSLAKAPLKVRLSAPPMPVTVVEPASAAPPAQEMPQLPSQVAEAYGHELFQSYWDWPLSRLEKKMRLLELDRELMKVEREELAGELQEARRMSWS
ncbi:unnamed protein product [Cladocopium goreaui]|uniref:Uncharacterized protein n=1 Tax=Cladocopium goreaui TaxID=2562237 RepID=A0A9P1D6U7_9DINO|nr:unnamed protein product [Cladocopium goreaui]